MKAVLLFAFAQQDNRKACVEWLTLLPQTWGIGFHNWQGSALQVRLSLSTFSLNEQSIKTAFKFAIERANKRLLLIVE